jgi:hypothetical protein
LFPLRPDIMRNRHMRRALSQLLLRPHLHLLFTTLSPRQQKLTLVKTLQQRVLRKRCTTV